MDLDVRASGDWTVKVCPINEIGSTNIEGSGNWVGGIFRATKSKYNATIHYEDGYAFKVHFCRVDQNYKTTVWSMDIEDDGSADVTLVAGGYYVPIIECVGEWSVDLGIGDPLETVN